MESLLIRGVARCTSAPSHPSGKDRQLEVEKTLRVQSRERAAAEYCE